ncbi:MAG: hypothetical protein WAN43_14140 [Rhodomicrobium sp.]
MSDSATPNAASLPGSCNAVRKAWIWIAAYALAEICFYIYFEWRNAVFGSVDEYPFFRGIALLFFLGASMYLLIKSLFKRQTAALLLYAVLFAINLGWPRIGTALDLTAKAYFFSAFPEMCPEGSPKPGYRVFLCYKYWFMESRTALVLNPGDEMGALSIAWPDEIKRELLGKGQPEIILSAADECFIRKTRLIVNHVYLVSDDCWWTSD